MENPTIGSCKVPIAEINWENSEAVRNYLIQAIREADLVAIDLEFSGIGEHPGSNSVFATRYKAAREVAKSRTILSLGIATFQRIGDENYKCKVFDLLALEQQHPVVVEPQAIAFLSSHGFDFNRLYGHGIRYSKHNTSYFKDLWVEILAASVSVAFHNGFLDLAFLHEHFYAPLPEKPEEFVATIANWFGEESLKKHGATLWDSKLLASQTPTFANTFLEYVSRKAQRLNFERLKAGESCIHVEFESIDIPDVSVDHVDISLSEQFMDGKIAHMGSEECCQDYKKFGNCRNRNCKKIHNIDLILDNENGEMPSQDPKLDGLRELNNQMDIANDDSMLGGKSQRKRKFIEDDERPKDEKSCENKQIRTTVGNNAENAHLPKGLPNPTHAPGNMGQHRAGMDAFTTGFSTLFLRLINDSGNQCAARIPLIGIEPLVLEKPSKVAQTEWHVVNWGRIAKRRDKARGIVEENN